MTHVPAGHARPAHSQSEAAAPLDYDVIVTAAKSAVQRAEFDRALALVAAAEAWPSPHDERGILARISVLCVRDPVVALEELTQVKDIFTTTEGRFGYFITSARAYASTRAFDSARAMLGEAAVLAPDLSKQHVALLAFHNARLKWLNREYEPDCGEIEVALRDGDIDTRFWALTVRAWMHAGLDDYHSQVKYLREAVELAMAYPGECDTYNTAITIHSLMRSSFELANDEAFGVAEKAAEKLKWTSDLKLDRFHSIRAQAWHAYLHGHSARALWLFKDAKEIAPTPAWRVMSHLDRAFVARMNLNEIWATEELHEAKQLARTVAWAETRGEERMVLTTMALLFAPTDMAIAQRYISTFIGLGVDSASPTMGVSFDRRTTAFERYASGNLHLVLGNVQLAKDLLTGSYEHFAKSDHHYRAAQCAVSLFEATHDAKWHELAAKHAAHFPNSPLAERIADMELDSGAPTNPFFALSSSQREIALSYCHGASVGEIAERFGRSATGIDMQLKAVFAALDAANRDQLRAKLSEFGLS